MSRHSTLSCILGCVSVCLFVATACAGRSFTRDGESEAGSGQGGAAAAAGKSSAGSVSSGGKVSGGGTGNVGNVGNVGGTGISTGGAGAAGGAAGYAGEGCTAPPVGGGCEAFFPAWYHDPSTGICRPFVYGGCGGNENRYGSLAECQKACKSGQPNFDACTVASDCVIAGNGCCGLCDGPNLSTHDFISYNRKFRDQLLCNFAAGARAPGADVPACAPCPPVVDGELKYFVPECVQGQCGVVDLRQSPLLACDDDTDCELRAGTSCCSSCWKSDLIALRKDAEIEKLVCDPSVPLGCPDCASPIMSERAVCTAGRCTVAN